MRRPARLLPRNTAEGVSVFVAAVLTVGAVLSTVDAGAASAAPDRNADADAGPRRSPSTSVGDSPVLPSSVAVLGRVPASTDAPLASAETGTAVSSGSDRTDDGVAARPRTTEPYNPWLGATVAQTPAEDVTSTPRPTSTRPASTRPTAQQPAAPTGSPSPATPPTAPPTPAVTPSPPPTAPLTTPTAPAPTPEPTTPTPDAPAPTTPEPTTPGPTTPEPTTPEPTTLEPTAPEPTTPDPAADATSTPVTVPPPATTTGGAPTPDTGSRVG